LKRGYSPDFACWEKIILELKACEGIADEHVAQVLNYLNATGYELGIIVNFGHYPTLEYQRVVRSQK
jgi:GxxExxY protein